MSATMTQVIEHPPTRYAGHDPNAVPIRYSGNDPEIVPMHNVNHSGTGSFEQSRNLYQNGGIFPDDLPERPAPPPSAQAPWKQRLRQFYTFSLSSYSLIHTPDGKARVRHLAMLTILALRTGMSALSILSAVVKGSIAGIVIYSLLTILGFWFTATCLAIIGDAEGDKPLGRLRIVCHLFATSIPQLLTFSSDTIAF